MLTPLAVQVRLLAPLVALVTAETPVHRDIDDVISNSAVPSLQELIAEFCVAMSVGVCSRAIGAKYASDDSIAHIDSFDALYLEAKDATPPLRVT